MSVNWLWKYKMGEIHVVQKYDGLPKQSYKVNIYAGNCLGVLLYEYKSKDTGKNMYNFWGFWNDLVHLQRILGLCKNYTDNLYHRPETFVVRVKLNIYYREMVKVATLFAKAGIKVEVFYEDPLTKSHYEVVYKDTNKMVSWDFSKNVCLSYVADHMDSDKLKVIKVGKRHASSL